MPDTVTTYVREPSHMLARPVYIFSYRFVFASQFDSAFPNLNLLSVERQDWEALRREESKTAVHLQLRRLTICGSQGFISPFNEIKNMIRNLQEKLFVAII